MVAYCYTGKDWYLLLASVFLSRLPTGPVLLRAFQRAGTAASIFVGSCTQPLSPLYYPPQLLAALGVEEI